ncbi:MAG: DUF1353 domain-containing protein [Deltaproteobacteria bacterium]|nr:DUF1353 domain-containing protein [Deltaproteobacteria bacterium]MBW2069508.1 DUF1353 domain-containing protein [Deltaproteobacteria bacterium]
MNRTTNVLNSGHIMCSRQAAVVHDYCYRTGCLSRKKCDQLFSEGMKVLGVPFWKRYVMYWVVRLFGQPCYHPHR